VGDAASCAQDSFWDGLLDCPHYTRPETHVTGEVPAVLRSGDHEAIRRWRLQQSLGRTWLRRPGLLAGRELTREQDRLLQDFIDNLGIDDPACG
jgi:tRNA (guanine37-N1)-methyltransferase